MRCVHNVCVCTHLSVEGADGQERRTEPKKDDRKRGRRGETGREGTWSGNGSVPLRPATSYHGASADR